MHEALGTISMKKIYFLLIVGLQTVFAQSDIIIEELKYNDFVSLPFVKSRTLEKNSIATKINQRLQDVVFGNGELLNKNNLHKIVEHLHIYSDTLEQSGIATLSYSVKEFPRFIRITVDIDWAGGPYPISPVTEDLHFDLYT